MAWAPSLKPSKRQSISLRNAPFEARFSVRILSEDYVTQYAFEILVPQAIQSILLEQRHGHGQFLAHYQEALLRSRTAVLSSFPALAPKLAGIVLKLLDEVVIHDVVDAIHADSIDMEVQHPVCELCLHDLARWNSSDLTPADGIETTSEEVVFEEVAAETVTAMLLRVIASSFDKVIEEVCILDGTAGAESHHHVLEKPGAVLVTSLNEFCEITCGRRP
jgi:hypothetical protein